MSTEDDVGLQTLIALSRQHRAANSKSFDELKALLGQQNSRIRENEKDIAGLKVWVPIVGGMAAIASAIASAVVQVMVR